MIHSVARVVLGDRIDEFARLHKQFLSDKSSILASDEFADYLSEDSNDDDLLWIFAYHNRRIEWIDWRGEEDPDQLMSFVQERVKDLASSELDLIFLERFEESLDLGKLQPGDYIVKKMSCIDAELRKKGFLLATFDRGDDQYYPFVASIEAFQAIEGVKIGSTAIIAWANI